MHTCAYVCRYAELKQQQLLLSLLLTMSKRQELQERQEQPEQQRFIRSAHKHKQPSQSQLLPVSLVIATYQHVGLHVFVVCAQTSTGPDLRRN